MKGGWRWFEVGRFAFGVCDRKYLEPRGVHGLNIVDGCSRDEGLVRWLIGEVSEGQGGIWKGKAVPRCSQAQGET